MSPVLSLNARFSAYSKQRAVKSLGPLPAECFPPPCVTRHGPNPTLEARFYPLHFAKVMEARGNAYGPSSHVIAGMEYPDPPKAKKAPFVAEPLAVEPA